MPNDSITRSCPICAEDIRTEAVTCRFCGSDVSVRLLFSGTQEELARKTGSGGTIEVGVGERIDDAQQFLRTHPHILEVEPHEDHLHVTLAPDAGDHSFLPEVLIKNGYRLTMLHEEEVKLEDVFMKITKGIVS